MRWGRGRSNDPEEVPSTSAGWRKDQRHHAEFAAQDYEDGATEAARLGRRRAAKAGGARMKENKERKKRGS